MLVTLWLLAVVVTIAMALVQAVLVVCVQVHCLYHLPFLTQ
jgi:hypothetical protein